MTSVSRCHLRRRLFVMLCGLVALTSGCGRGALSGAVSEPGASGVAPASGSPDVPVVAWNLAQEGTDSGVKWSVLVGDSAKEHLRCISLDLDPKPPSLFPPVVNPVDPRTGQTIPPPPPLAAALASGEGQRLKGCAPSPSLTSTSTQPLQTLTAHEPDGGKGTYSYAAGTVTPEIQKVTAEFSDGTTAQAVVSQGTFVVIYPPTKKLAGLRPTVPEFPDLLCTVTPLQVPPLPGGGPGFKLLSDGGCTGYTVEFKPFG
ncbi:MAG TPA: hypothetical protein VG795_09905 [Acidimicrobiia bacterium]|nr:hypothetical protein [Acidimicrobiia bacterium]